MHRLKKAMTVATLVAICVTLITVPRFLGQAGNPGAWTFNHNAHYFVSADQSFSADTSLHTITGLSIAMPNISSPTFLQVKCRLFYSQATAAVANIYGVQFTTNGPTNSAWYAEAQTAVAATGVYAATAPTATLTGTSATTLTTATPAATSTIYGVNIEGFVEWPANTAGTLNIQAGTGNASDALTIKRDSGCYFPGQ